MDGFEGISAAVPRTVTAAGVERAVDPDASAHQMHERGRNRQAETGTAFAGMAAIKSLEDKLLLSRRDTRPIVRYRCY